jgi:hypothetical protein
MSRCKRHLVVPLAPFGERITTTKVPSVDIFNNLPNLQYLFLNNNKIRELHHGTFNNLPNLRYLFLTNNHQRCLWQIRELQPPPKVPLAKVSSAGIFNNLPSLEVLFLRSNHRRCLWQIRELQPNSYYGLSRHVILYI